MEIQHGKGPWAPPVSGIVPLGSTLTLVVAINDYRGRKVQITSAKSVFRKKIRLYHRSIIQTKIHFKYGIRNS